MPDETETKSASGGPLTAARPAAAPAAPASAEDTKAANDRIRERLDTTQKETVERNRAASTDSKATTAGHVGKRADEPHKPYEMEAAKVGKPIPAGKKGGIDIDPAGKGTPTDTVLPGGFPPSSPMHSDDLRGALPVNPPDAAGTVREVAATIGESGESPKVEGDPGAEAGREAHAAQAESEHKE